MQTTAGITIPIPRRIYTNPGQPIKVDRPLQKSPGNVTGFVANPHRYSSRPPLRRLRRPKRPSFLLQIRIPLPCHPTLSIPNLPFTHTSLKRRPLLFLPSSRLLPAPREPRRTMSRLFSVTSFVRLRRRAYLPQLSRTLLHSQ